MVSVQVRPRGSAVLGAGLAAAEVTAAMVAAHTLAGGALPSWPWIALMAGTVFAGGLPVLRGRVRPLLALPALVVVQLGLHLWLMVLTPAAEMAGHSGHQMSDGGLHAHLGWGMLLAHTVGAVVTAAVWELRRRAVDVVLTWSDAAPAPAVPLAPRPVRRTPLPARTLLLLAAVPRRGPPVSFAAA